MKNPNALSLAAIVLMIMGCCSIHAQDYLFFGDSENDEYYDPSWGFVESPSALELFADGPKAPLEKSTVYSGRNSLKLSWLSQEGGSWGVAIAAPGWVGKDATLKDSLVFMAYAAEKIEPENLPLIYLEDTNNRKSGKIGMGEYASGGLSQGWTKVAVPLAAFLEHRGDADFMQIKTVFFGQGAADNQPRTLYLAEIRMSGETPPGNYRLIVVLGSSSAAGIGPQPVDSAWVNRYREYLTKADSSYKVMNLAVSGFTSYRLMPTGYFPPPNRSDQVSLHHNITAALALKPELIIISLPSNDAANGFGIEEQIANFDTLVMQARRQGAPLWITTTQPRNFENPEQRQNLMAMRDSILARYPRQGMGVIDFWSGIADGEGRILPQYDCGDQIHLNNAAHRILFQRVAAAIHGKE